MTPQQQLGRREYDAHAEMVGLAAKVEAMHSDVIETKVLAQQTNGRLRKLELWQARMEGARAAFHWVPPLVTGLLTAGVTAGVTLLLTAH